MFELDLCLSASVNVRYVLHTHPLGLYNKILVGLSLYLPLLNCPSSPITPSKVPLHATFLYHPSFAYPINHSHQMMSSNIGVHGSSPNSLVVNAQDSQPSQTPTSYNRSTMVNPVTKKTNPNVPPTEGKSMSRKRKKVTQDGASKALDKQAKKQCQTSKSQQACHCCKRRSNSGFLQSHPSDSERKQQPSSEMSHIYRNFYVYVPLPLFGRIQCTTCGQKGHHFED